MTAKLPPSLRRHVRPVLPVARRVRAHADDARYRLWLFRLPEPPRLERPVFVIGSPRSGTNTCVALFGSHPMVANWSEAGRVWDPRTYDDREADHHWTAADVRDDDVRRLNGRFEYFRVMEGKSRFVNKHPRNSVRIGYLDAVFPDAVYIHLVRDGRAVAHSIVAKIDREPYRQQIPFGDFCKPVGWRDLLRDDPLEQAALQWREIVGHVLQQRDLLGDRYLQLRYEDMCARPREVFASLFEFAGLAAGPTELAGVPAQLSNMNHKYREALPPDRIELMERVQQPLLEELGYPVPD